MSDPMPAPSVHVGAAVSWAARALRSDLLPFMILAIIPVVLTASQGIGTTSIQNLLIDCINPQTPGQENACAAALSPTSLAPVLMSVVLVFVAFVAQVGVMRGALQRSRGQSPSFADMLEPRNFRAFAVYVLLYRVLFFIGLVLCILPGLLVLVFFQFGPYLILDRGLGVIDAFRASATMAARNLGPVASVAVISGLLELIGGLFFGLPMLITLPLAALFTVHVYRQISGETVD